MKTKLKLKFDESKIRISVTPEEEDMSIKRAAKDCAPGFEEAVRANVRKHRRWGWCTVRVTATLPDIDVQGNAYLGACSYTSKKDFMSGGYFEQMVEEAKDELRKELKRHVEDVKDMVESLKGVGVDINRTVMFATG